MATIINFRINLEGIDQLDNLQNQANQILETFKSIATQAGVARNVIRGIGTQPNIYNSLGYQRPNVIGNDNSRAVNPASNPANERILKESTRTTLQPTEMSRAIATGVRAGLEDVKQISSRLDARLNASTVRHSTPDVPFTNRSAVDIENSGRETARRIEREYLAASSSILNRLREIGIASQGIASLPAPRYQPGGFVSSGTFSQRTAGRSVALTPANVSEVKRASTDFNAFVSRQERQIASSITQLEKAITNAFTKGIDEGSRKILEEDTLKRLNSEFRLLGASIKEIADKAAEDAEEAGRLLSRASLTENVRTNRVTGQSVASGLNLNLLNVKALESLAQRHLGESSIGRSTPELTTIITRLRNTLKDQFETQLKKAIVSFDVPAPVATETGLRVVSSGQKGTTTRQNVDFVKINYGIDRLTQALASPALRSIATQAGVNAGNPYDIQAKLLKGVVSDQKVESILKAIAAINKGVRGSDVKNTDIGITANEIRDAVISAISQKAGRERARELIYESLPASKTEAERASLSRNISEKNLSQKQRDIVRSTAEDVRRKLESSGRNVFSQSKDDNNSLLAIARQMGVSITEEIIPFLTTVQRQNVIDEFRQNLFADAGGSGKGLRRTSLGGAFGRLVGFSGRKGEGSISRARGVFQGTANRTLENLEPLDNNVYIDPNTGKPVDAFTLGKIIPQALFTTPRPLVSLKGEAIPSSIFRKRTAETQINAGRLRDLQERAFFSSDPVLSSIQGFLPRAVSEETAARLRPVGDGKIQFKAAGVDYRELIPFALAAGSTRRQEQIGSGSGPSLPLLRTRALQQGVDEGTIKPFVYNAVRSFAPAPSNFEDQILVSISSPIAKAVTGTVTQLITSINDRFKTTGGDLTSDPDAIKEVYKAGETISTLFGASSNSISNSVNVARIIGKASNIDLRQGSNESQAHILDVLNEYASVIGGRKLLGPAGEKGSVRFVPSLGFQETPTTAAGIISQLGRGGIGKDFDKISANLTRLGNILLLSDEHIQKLQLALPGGPEGAALDTDKVVELANETRRLIASSGVFAGKLNQSQSAADFATSFRAIARAAGVQTTTKRAIDYQVSGPDVARRGLRTPFHELIANQLFGDVATVIGNESPEFLEQIVKDLGESLGFEKLGKAGLHVGTKITGGFERPNEVTLAGMSAVSEILKSRPQYGTDEDTVLKIDPNTFSAIENALGRDSAFVKQVIGKGATPSNTTVELIKLLASLDSTVLKLNPHLKGIIGTLGTLRDIDVNNIETLGDAIVSPERLRGTLFDPLNPSLAGAGRLGIPEDILRTAQRLRPDVLQGSSIYIPSAGARGVFRTSGGQVGVGGVGKGLDQLIKAVKEYTTGSGDERSALAGGVGDYINKLYESLDDGSMEPDKISSTVDDLINKLQVQGVLRKDVFAGYKKLPADVDPRAKIEELQNILLRGGTTYFSGQASPYQPLLKPTSGILKQEVVAAVQGIFKNSAGTIGRPGFGDISFTRAGGADEETTKAFLRSLESLRSEVSRQLLGKDALIDKGFLNINIPNRRLAATQKPIDISREVSGLQDFLRSSFGSQEAVEQLISGASKFAGDIGVEQAVSDLRQAGNYLGPGLASQDLSQQLADLTKGIDTLGIDEMEIHEDRLREAVVSLLKSGQINKAEAKNIFGRALRGKDGGQHGLSVRFPATGAGSALSYRLKVIRNRSLRQILGPGKNLENVPESLRGFVAERLQAADTAEPGVDVLGDESQIFSERLKEIVGSKNAGTPENVKAIEYLDRKRAEILKTSQARYTTAISGTLPEGVQEQFKTLFDPSKGFDAEFGAGVLPAIRTILSRERRGILEKTPGDVTAADETRLQQLNKQINELNKAMAALSGRFRATTQNLDNDGDRLNLVLATSAKANDELRQKVEAVNSGFTDFENISNTLTSVKGGTKVRIGSGGPGTTERVDILDAIEKAISTGGGGRLIPGIGKAELGLFQSLRGENAFKDVREYLKNEAQRRIDNPNAESPLKEFLKVSGLRLNLDGLNERNINTPEGAEILDRETASVLEQHDLLATVSKLAGPKIYTGPVTESANTIVGQIKRQYRNRIEKLKANSSLSKEGIDALEREMFDRLKALDDFRTVLINEGLSSKHGGTPHTVKFLEGLELARVGNIEDDEKDFNRFLSEIKEPQAGKEYGAVIAGTKATEANRRRDLESLSSRDELIDRLKASIRLNGSITLDNRGFTEADIDSGSLDTELSNISSAKVIDALSEQYGLLGTTRQIRGSLKENTIEELTTKFREQEKRLVSGGQSFDDARAVSLNELAKLFGVVRRGRLTGADVINRLVKSNPDLGMGKTSLISPETDIEQVISSLVELRGPRTFSSRGKYNIRTFRTKETEDLERLFGTLGSLQYPGSDTERDTFLKSGGVVSGLLGTFIEAARQGKTGSTENRVLSNFINKTDSESEEAINIISGLSERIKNIEAPGGNFTDSDRGRVLGEIDTTIRNLMGRLEIPVADIETLRYPTLYAREDLLKSVRDSKADEPTKQAALEAFGGDVYGLDFNALSQQFPFIKDSIEKLARVVQNDPLKDIEKTGRTPEIDRRLRALNVARLESEAQTSLQSNLEFFKAVRSGQTYLETDLSAAATSEAALPTISALDEARASFDRAQQIQQIAGEQQTSGGASEALISLLKSNSELINQLIQELRTLVNFMYGKGGSGGIGGGGPGGPFSGSGPKTGGLGGLGGKKLVFFDFETAGKLQDFGNDPSKVPIHQLGYVVADETGVRRVQRKIKPSTTVAGEPTDFALRHGFDRDAYENDPNSVSEQDAIRELVGELTTPGAVLGGHNIKGFDLPIFRAAYKRAGFGRDDIPTPEILDTLVEAQRIRGRGKRGEGRNTLETLSREFGFGELATHQAGADAEASLRVAIELASREGHTDVADRLKTLLSETSTATARTNVEGALSAASVGFNNEEAVGYLRNIGLPDELIPNFLGFAQGLTPSATGKHSGISPSIISTARGKGAGNLTLSDFIGREGGIDIESVPKELRPYILGDAASTANIEALALGNAVDAAIEAYHGSLGQNPQNLDKAKRKAEDALNTSIGLSSLAGGAGATPVRDMALGMLSKYAQDPQKRGRNVVGSQLRLAGTTTGGNQFGGILDLLEVDAKGNLVITDVKTSRNPVSYDRLGESVSDPYTRQLATYSLALRNLATGLGTEGGEAAFGEFAKSNKLTPEKTEELRALFLDIQSGKRRLLAGIEPVTGPSIGPFEPGERIFKQVNDEIDELAPIINATRESLFARARRGEFEGSLGFTPRARYDSAVSAAAPQNAFFTQDRTRDELSLISRAVENAKSGGLAVTPAFAGSFLTSLRNDPSNERLLRLRTGLAQAFTEGANRNYAGYFGNLGSSLGESDIDTQEVRLSAQAFPELFHRARVGQLKAEDVEKLPGALETLIHESGHLRLGGAISAGAIDPRRMFADNPAAQAEFRQAMSASALKYVTSGNADEIASGEGFTREDIQGVFSGKKVKLNPERARALKRVTDTVINRALEEMLAIMLSTAVETTAGVDASKLKNAKLVTGLSQTVRAGLLDSLAKAYDFDFSQASASGKRFSTPDDPFESDMRGLLEDYDRKIISAAGANDEEEVNRLLQERDIKRAELIGNREFYDLAKEGKTPDDLDTPLSTTARITSPVPTSSMKEFLEFNEQLKKVQAEAALNVYGNQTTTFGKVGSSPIIKGATQASLFRTLAGDDYENVKVREGIDSANKVLRDVKRLERILSDIKGGAIDDPRKIRGEVGGIFVGARSGIGKDPAFTRRVSLELNTAIQEAIFELIQKNIEQLKKLPPGANTQEIEKNIKESTDLLYRQYVESSFIEETSPIRMPNKQLIPSALQIEGLPETIQEKIQTLALRGKNDAIIQAAQTITRGGGDPRTRVNQAVSYLIEKGYPLNRAFPELRDVLKFSNKSAGLKAGLRPLEQSEMDAVFAAIKQTAGFYGKSVDTVSETTLNEDQIRKVRQFFEKAALKKPGKYGSNYLKAANALLGQNLQTEEEFNKFFANLEPVVDKTSPSMPEATRRILAQRSVGNFRRIAAVRAALGATEADALGLSAADALNIKTGGTRYRIVNRPSSGPLASEFGLRFQESETPIGTGEGRQNLGQAFRRVALWGAASGIVFGVINAFQQMISTIQQAEVNIIELRKVMNPATTDFDTLRDSAIGFAKEFGTSVNQVLDSFVTFAKQGLGQADVLTRGRASVLAGNVTEGLDPVKATEIFTAALKQFPEEGADALRFLDSLNEVANRFAVTEVDLGESLKKAATSAKIAGVSFDEFLGLTTALTEATRKSGSEVGTSLNFMIRSLFRPKSRQALAEIGISVVDEKGLRSATDILADLATKFDSLSSAQQLSVVEASVGTRRYNDFAVILKNFNTAMDAAAVSANAQGSSLRENELVMTSLAKKVQVLGASFQQLGIELGDVVIPYIKAFIDVITVAVDTLSSIPNSVKLTIAGLSALFVIMGRFEHFAFWGKDIFSGLSSKPIIGGFIDGLNRGITAIRTSRQAMAVTLAGFLILFTDFGTKLKEVVGSAFNFIGSGIGYEGGDETEKAIRKQLSQQEERLIRLTESRQKVNRIGSDFSRASNLESVPQDEVLSRINEGIFESPIAIRNQATEKQRELINEIAKTNLDLVAGYDAQGNAILRQNDLLGVQLDFVKEIFEVTAATSKLKIAEGYAKDITNVERFWSAIKSGLSNLTDIGRFFADKIDLSPLTRIQDSVTRINELIGKRNAGDYSVDDEINRLQSDLTSSQSDLDILISKFFDNLQPALGALPINQLRSVLTSEENFGALGQVATRELARNGKLVGLSPFDAEQAIGERRLQDLASLLFSRFGVPARGVTSGQGLAQRFEETGLIPRGIQTGSVQLRNRDVVTFSKEIADNLGSAAEFAVFIGDQFKILDKDGRLRDITVDAFSKAASFAEDRFTAVFSNVAQEVDQSFVEATRAAKKITAGAGFGVSFEGDVNLGARLERELDPQIRLFRAFENSRTDLGGGSSQNLLRILRDQQKTLQSRLKEQGLTEGFGAESQYDSEQVDRLTPISNKAKQAIKELQETIANNAAVVTLRLELQNLGDTIEDVANRIIERRQQLEVRQFTEANLLTGNRNRNIPDFGNRPIRLSPFERLVQSGTVLTGTVDRLEELNSLQNEGGDILTNIRREQNTIGRILRDFGRAGILDIEGIDSIVRTTIESGSEAGLQQTLTALQNKEIEVSQSIFIESARSNELLTKLLETLGYKPTEEEEAKFNSIAERLDAAVKSGNASETSGILSELITTPNLNRGRIKDLIGQTRESLRESIKVTGLTNPDVTSSGLENYISDKLGPIDAILTQTLDRIDPLKLRYNFDEVAQSTQATLESLAQFALGVNRDILLHRQTIGSTLDSARFLFNDFFNTIEQTSLNILSGIRGQLSTFSAPSLGVGQLSGFRSVQPSVDLRRSLRELSPEEAFFADRQEDVYSLNILNSAFQETTSLIGSLSNVLATANREGQSGQITSLIESQINVIADARERIGEEITSIADALSKGLPAQKVINSLNDIKREFALFEINQRTPLDTTSIDLALDIQPRQLLRRGNRLKYGDVGLTQEQQQIELSKSTKQLTKEDKERYKALADQIEEKRLLRQRQERLGGELDFAKRVKTLLEEASFAGIKEADDVLPQLAKRVSVAGQVTGFSGGAPEFRGINIKDLVNTSIADIQKRVDEARAKTNAQAISKELANLLGGINKDALQQSLSLVESMNEKNIQIFGEQTDILTSVDENVANIYNILRSAVGSSVSPATTAAQKKSGGTQGYGYFNGFAPGTGLAGAGPYFDPKTGQVLTPGNFGPQFISGSPFTANNLGGLFDRPVGSSSNRSYPDRFSGSLVGGTGLPLGFSGGQFLGAPSVLARVGVGFLTTETGKRYAASVLGKTDEIAGGLSKLDNSKLLIDRITSFAKKGDLSTLTGRGLGVTDLGKLGEAIKYVDIATSGAIQPQEYYEKLPATQKVLDELKKIRGKIDNRLVKLLTSIGSTVSAALRFIPEKILAPIPEALSGSNSKILRGVGTGLTATGRALFGAAGATADASGGLIKRLGGSIAGIPNKLGPLGFAGIFELLNVASSGMGSYKEGNEFPTIAYDALFGRRVSTSGRSGLRNTASFAQNIISGAFKGAAVGGTIGAISGPGSAFTAGGGALVGGGLALGREIISILSGDRDIIRQGLQEATEPEVKIRRRLNEELTRVQTELEALSFDGLSEEQKTRRDALIQQAQEIKNISTLLDRGATGEVSPTDAARDITLAQSRYLDSRRAELKSGDTLLGRDPLRIEEAAVDSGFGITNAGVKKTLEDNLSEFLKAGAGNKGFDFNQLSNRFQNIFIDEIKKNLENKSFRDINLEDIAKRTLYEADKEGVFEGRTDIPDIQKQFISRVSQLPPDFDVRTAKALQEGGSNFFGGRSSEFSRIISSTLLKPVETKTDIKRALLSETGRAQNNVQTSIDELIKSVDGYSDSIKEINDNLAFVTEEEAARISEIQKLLDSEKIKGAVEAGKTEDIDSYRRRLDELAKIGDTLSERATTVNKSSQDMLLGGRGFIEGPNGRIGFTGKSYSVSDLFSDVRGSGITEDEKNKFYADFLPALRENLKTFGIDIAESTLAITKDSSGQQIISSAPGLGRGTSIDQINKAFIGAGKGNVFNAMVDRISKGSNEQSALARFVRAALAERSTKNNVVIQDTASFAGPFFGQTLAYDKSKVSSEVEGERIYQEESERKRRNQFISSRRAAFEALHKQGLFRNQGLDEEGNIVGIQGVDYSSLDFDSRQYIRAQERANRTKDLFSTRGVGLLDEERRQRGLDMLGSSQFSNSSIGRGLLDSGIIGVFGASSRSLGFRQEQVNRSRNDILSDIGFLSTLGLETKITGKGRDAKEGLFFKDTNTQISDEAARDTFGLFAQGKKEEAKAGLEQIRLFGEDPRKDLAKRADERKSDFSVSTMIVDKMVVTNAELSNSNLNIKGLEDLLQGKKKNEEGDGSVGAGEAKTVLDTIRELQQRMEAEASSFQEKVYSKVDEKIESVSTKLAQEEFANRETSNQLSSLRVRLDSMDGKIKNHERCITGLDYKAPPPAK